MEQAEERFPVKRSEIRDMVRCADWIRARGEPIDVEVWDTVLDIMRNHRAPLRTRLTAARVIAERIDPTPRAPILVSAPTQVNVTWQDPSPPSSSPTPPAPDNGTYTVNYGDGTAS